MGSACCRDVRVGSLGLDTLGASCSSSLTASGRLGSSPGAAGSPEMGRWVGGRRAGAEPVGEEEEALQFGLVFLESALALGGEWPRLASAPALGCHRRPRWRWTGRHLAALPGPGRAGGAPCGLRTRLGHQDGLLPYFQDVC